MHSIHKQAFKLATMVVCCVGILAASGTSLPQLPPHQVVARVNGVELYGNTLNDYVRAVIPDYSFHGKVKPDKLNEYRRSALDRMVLHELIYQDGVRRHFAVSTSKVDAEIAIIKGRFRSPSDFQRSLASRGLTLAQLRDSIQRSFVIEAVVRHDVTVPSRVSEQRVRAYYRKNLRQFREPETIHISEIFIPSGPGETAQAKDVHSQAVAKNTTEQFYQLASRYSKDDYRVMGGDRGWMHKGRLEPELEKAAFALRQGQVSPVIETYAGAYVLRVEGKHAAHLAPYREARNQIRQQLVDEKKQLLVKALRERVYKNAKIEILAEFGAGGAMASH